MSVTSPFKFLDAYEKDDKDIFFGRDNEVEYLYDLVFQSNLTLVYGESGTGKTSLIQCGLANRFAQSDWFNVYVRRNEDINVSLLETLKKFRVEEQKQKRSSLSDRLKRRRQGTSVKKSSTQTAAPKADELTSILRSLYKYYLKPVYLIFDQFEELFILGNPSEQRLFYQSIEQILTNEAYCRVIIIMREEHIAQMYDFEKVVEFLFEKRLRVEKMSRTRMEEVISRTTDKFGIHLEEESISGQIIDVLGEGEGQVELTHLQVFLDQLYQEAAPASSNGVTFSSALVEKQGSIEDVLGDFLDRQTREIQQDLEKEYKDVPPEAVTQMLSAFATLEGTKRPLAKNQIQTGKLSIEEVDFIIRRLELSRIIRFDNELYELSHDTLARQVANKRSEDEVALLQITKLVKDRNQAFETTKTHLNGNELQLISGFEPRLEAGSRLTPNDWAFVKQSKQVNRRRRLARAGIIAAIITVLAAFSAFSYQLSVSARRSAEQAEESLRQLEEAQASQRAANYNRFMQAGNAKMVMSDYVGAKESYETALTFNPEGTEAKDSIQAAESRSTASVEFEQLMREGDALFNLNNNSRYVDAMQKYRAAFRLNYNNSLAQSKIDATNGKMAIAFEKFKDDGDAFFAAGGAAGFRNALRSYRQAARIRPGDSYIQRRIREAQAQLNQ